MVIIIYLKWKNWGVASILFATMLVCILFTLSTSIISNTNLCEYKIKEMVKIVAISDGSNSSGQFFLGSGSIKTTQYYFFYKLNEDGSYSQDKLPVEDCKIFEDSTVQPCIVKYCLTPKTQTWILWASPIPKYKIYVPNKTIMIDFKLDLN
jgi:hypothetical protein